MKKIMYLMAVMLTAHQLSAQTPEDAIRMSWQAPSGTARNQAIGGAMGSLGGEITGLFVNPAGLAFYKTNEIVLSPALSLFNGNSNFRGFDATANPFTKFNLGTTGFVWSQPAYGRWGNKSYSLAINRTANFNGTVYYGGENNYSSFSESFAEEFSQSGEDLDTDLFSAPLSLGTKLALYTYLIDTVTANGANQVVGLPQRDAIVNGIDAELSQEKSIRTKGGITEIAFGFASNMEDKLYLGGSIGVPIVNYERESTITETDISGNTNNNFDYATYTENYRSQGVGINARLGLIFKPVEQFRTGVAIHTPTLYGLKEKTRGRMETSLEQYFTDPAPRIADENTIYTDEGVEVPQYRYDLVSPWKFLFSGSYMINAVEDVTKQRGFITADVEYVTHPSSKFYSAEQGDDDQYYRSVNEATKLSYKGAFNFRVGGELKFNTVMTRLGFSYYGSPYKDTELKARRMNISGGVGYRNRGVFVDLAYVHGLNKNVDFPYRLSDKANTFADIRDHNGNVILTLGFKF